MPGPSQAHAMAWRVIDTASQSGLYRLSMRNFLAIAIACLALGGCVSPKIPATKLEKANILPMQLNDDFQFRKVKLYYNQPVVTATVPIQSEAIAFEARRVDYGAITNVDRVQLQGNYFSFFWRNKGVADVTVRLEYRQSDLGNYVMAQERYYPNAKGTHQSDFSVIGDDYLEAGAVTSWRALLIVDGRIVALTQSYMWR